MRGTKAEAEKWLRLINYKESKMETYDPKKWHRNVVRNLRDLYKLRYGKDAPQTDEQIWEFYSRYAGTGTDASEEDDSTLLDMNVEQ